MLETQELDIVERIKAGETYRSIAADYDVTYQCIGLIAKKWKVNREGVKTRQHKKAVEAGYSSWDEYMFAKEIQKLEKFLNK